MPQSNQDWKSKLRYFACHRGSNCVCGKDCGGKRPLNTGWQDEATNDPEAVAKLRSDPGINVGILCGSDSDLCVLDIDPDKRGHESLKKLEAELGPLPDTYTV